MIDRIGKEYLTTNIEAGEYSYVQEASSKEKLEKAIVTIEEELQVRYTF